MGTDIKECENAQNCGDENSAFGGIADRPPDSVSVVQRLIWISRSRSRSRSSMHPLTQFVVRGLRLGGLAVLGVVEPCSGDRANKDGSIVIAASTHLRQRPRLQPARCS